MIKKIINYFLLVYKFMANLIKPGEVKLVTKNNEVFVNISLELNIKLDGNITSLGIDAKASKPNKIEEEKVSWEIPDFSPSKIDFGR
jgi:hypothetical protein